LDKERKGGKRTGKVERGQENIDEVLWNRDTMRQVDRSVDEMKKTGEIVGRIWTGSDKIACLSWDILFNTYFIQYFF
jgi:hypothetical protein